MRHKCAFCDTSDSFTYVFHETSTLTPTEHGNMWPAVASCPNLDDLFTTGHSRSSLNQLETFCNAVSDERSESYPTTIGIIYNCSQGCDAQLTRSGPKVKIRMLSRLTCLCFHVLCLWPAVDRLSPCWSRAPWDICQRTSVGPLLRFESVNKGTWHEV
jgi:hypothetical protein